MKPATKSQAASACDSQAHFQGGVNIKGLDLKLLFALVKMSRALYFRVCLFPVFVVWQLERACFKTSLSGVEI